MGNVADDVLIIEGKHEEKTQEGHAMVSRQFRRQYGLSSDVKKTEVVSNLSQDGVLVVTLPKEKRLFQTMISLKSVWILLDINLMNSELQLDKELLSLRLSMRKEPKLVRSWSPGT